MASFGHFHHNLILGFLLESKTRINSRQFALWKSRFNVFAKFINLGVSSNRPTNSIAEVLQLLQGLMGLRELHLKIDSIDKTEDLS